VNVVTSIRPGHHASQSRDQVPDAPRRVQQGGARDRQRDGGASGERGERVAQAGGLRRLRAAGEIAGRAQDEDRGEQPDGPPRA
jgi:hypothetical protein